MSLSGGSGSTAALCKTPWSLPTSPMATFRVRNSSPPMENKANSLPFKTAWVASAGGVSSSPSWPPPERYMTKDSAVPPLGLFPCYSRPCTSTLILTALMSVTHLLASCHKATELRRVNGATTWLLGQIGVPFSHARWQSTLIIPKHLCVYATRP